MGMGIRSLNFHMLPYCFHLIYNHISCINLSSSSSSSHHQTHSPPTAPTITLIRSDGDVTIYRRPIPASLPMQQFPKHLICDSDSFFLGQPLPALSASDTLQLGHSYFLLPSHLFQSVLSFLTLASFASHHHAFKSPTCRRPFDILKTASGSVQIRVSDEFIQSLMVREERKAEEAEDAGKKRLCSTPQLEKDYQMLVAGWKRLKERKPKLETIEEKERRKIGGGGFGMRKRKKKSPSHSRSAMKAL